MLWSFSLAAFLDWLDEAAGGLIRLAYLAAGVTAVAVYFGAGQLPVGLDHVLNAALPWALAFALETHTYLTARRVRGAWQERDTGALGVNVTVLAVLLAFSAWNQLGYLSGVWTPPHTGPLALPPWAAYAVRALIVPSAFMAAAFLAPLAPPITAQIEGEARATLADVFKIARKQRRKMLKQAERLGRDMTGALVELVSDPDTRRIISHAYNTIRTPDAPEQAITIPAITGTPLTVLTPLDVAQRPRTVTPEAAQDVAQLSASTAHSADAPADTHAPSPPDDPPPTGPGSPIVGSNPRPSVSTGSAANVTPLRRGLGKAPRRDKRTASRTNARSGERGKAKVRVQALLDADPSIEFEQLVKQARVSRSTASKWREAWLVEQRANATGEQRAL